MNTNLLHFFLNYARLYKIMGLKILWHYLPLTHYFSDGCHTILDSYLIHPFKHFWSRLPGGSGVKGSACNAGDLGSISGSGRSPGEGNGNPLQYSCLENPTDRGAWQATVHGVAKSWTRLSDFTSDGIIVNLFPLCCLIWLRVKPFGSQKFGEPLPLLPLLF